MMASRRGRRRLRVEQPPPSPTLRQQRNEVTSTSATPSSKPTEAAATTNASSVDYNNIATSSYNNNNAAANATGTGCDEPPAEVKMEILDSDDDDLKPNVLELQQQLLRLQQQQQQQQLLQPQQQPVGAQQTLATPTALLPPPGNHVFLIGDLSYEGLALAPFTATNSVLLQNGGSFLRANGNVGVESNAAAAAAIGLGGVRPIVANAVSTATAPTTTTTRTTTAAAASPANATPTVSKLLDDAFEWNEFDLQESDSDEEGYSDIDFEEDDELIEVDDDEPDVYDPVWANRPTEPRMVFCFNTPAADVGIEGRPKSIHPIFYFDKLLGGQRDDFFRQLAIGCNRRAKLLANANSVGQTYLKQITVEEMQCFFGLCLQMSSLRLNTLADYWNEEANYGFRGFGNAMSLNRFRMLLRVFNFEQFKLSKTSAANGAEKPTDALAELKPLLNFFNHRMANMYKCGQRLVLNEPLMYWKGRMQRVRDLSDKFRCNAVTLHFLTEQSGLLLKIVADVESNERKQHVRNSKQLMLQRMQIAKELLKEKLGKGHTVFASKYYGSYGLGCDLRFHQTYCSGVLDSKRYGNCKQLILSNLENKAFATKYATSIMMGKWRRRQKCTYFYSSDCLAIYAHETSYHSDSRPKIIKEIDWQLRAPPNVRAHMLDYQLGLERREIKWDKELAIYVFNLMVLNSYILYTRYAQFGRNRTTDMQLKDLTKMKTYAEFRQNIIAALLKNEAKEEAEQLQRTLAAEKVAARQATGANSDDDECETAPHGSVVALAHKKLLEIEHMPMMIPRRKGKVMKKKCRICRKVGLTTCSKLCCEICPGKPGLCETPCFKIFHDHLKKSLSAGEHIKTRTFGRSGEQTIYF